MYLNSKLSKAKCSAARLSLTGPRGVPKAFGVSRHSLVDVEAAAAPAKGLAGPGPPGAVPRRMESVEELVTESEDQNRNSLHSGVRGSSRVDGDRSELMSISIEEKPLLQRSPTMGLKLKAHAKVIADAGLSGLRSLGRSQHSIDDDDEEMLSEDAIARQWVNLSKEDKLRSLEVAYQLMGRVLRTRSIMLGTSPPLERASVREIGCVLKIFSVCTARTPSIVPRSSGLPSVRPVRYRIVEW